MPPKSSRYTRDTYALQRVMLARAWMREGPHGLSGRVYL
jgi:hypothetical protein